jgi:hypothetical protein
MVGYAQPVQLISSEHKEVGWQRYLGSRQTLLDSSLSTSQRLLRIHRTLTEEEVLPLVKEELEVLKSDLYILDRLTDGKIEDRLSLKEEELEKTIGDRINNDGLHPSIGLLQFYREALKCRTSLYAENAEINLDMQISGGLRSLGTRTIDDFTERVFGSHTYNCSSPGFDPITYFGLTAGLDEVYEALCTKYDELMQENKDADLDVMLMGEAFLNLLGSRVVHPFWDANKRTFATHVASTLESRGVEISEYSQIVSMTDSLNNIGNEFLMEVLKNGRVHIPENNGYYELRIDPLRRADYMGKLRAEIERAISQGIDVDGDYYKFYLRAAREIKDALTQFGLLESAI